VYDGNLRRRDVRPRLFGDLELSERDRLSARRSVPGQLRCGRVQWKRRLHASIELRHFLLGHRIVSDRRDLRNWALHHPLRWRFLQGKRGLRGVIELLDRLRCECVSEGSPLRPRAVHGGLRGQRVRRRSRLFGVVKLSGELSDERLWHRRDVRPGLLLRHVRKRRVQRGNRLPQLVPVRRHMRGRRAVHSEFDLSRRRVQKYDRVYVDRGNLQHVSMSLERGADVSRPTLS
jgi:hypothetical protein